MPATFTRLRIAGFKSFAEPVSIEILPGLTGIVGPNGCGKSNVVEALRWTMGESSSRSLRGGEMDDLIFAGTTSRSARNLAEVLLTIDDAIGIAPPPFHELVELQISRRIERGIGSAYRINGRETRARDVQTLFADMASGARSSAMISQGRVSAIVSAKPEERRGILEEAAGITGLHARRHEAESKLRAAEVNLVRAEDLRLQLDGQARSLIEQAAEASRYREIAAGLRACEDDLLALLHARARRAVRLADGARLAAAAAHEAAANALEIAARNEQAAEAARSVPCDAESVARILLERRRIEVETATRDDASLAEEAAQARARADQAHADHVAAVDRLHDARTEMERLAEELATLDLVAASLPNRIEIAGIVQAATRNSLLDAERRAKNAAQAAVLAAAAYAEHWRDIAEARTRLDRAAARQQALVADRHREEAGLPSADAIEALESVLDVASDQIAAAETALDHAVQARAKAARMATDARLACDDATRRHHEAVDADADAARRVEALDVEWYGLQARLDEAHAGLATDADRDQARDGVLVADRMLALSSAAFDAAETACAEAVLARIETAARVHEAAGMRAHAMEAGILARTGAERATVQYDLLMREHGKALALSLPPGLLDAAARRCRDATADILAVQTRMAEAEDAFREAARKATHAADLLTTLREKAGRLSAEADGLALSLSSAGDPETPLWRTLAEILDIPASLEDAVAACLADGLDAGCVPEALQTWLPLPRIQASCLPAGTRRLSDLLQAPEPLTRALDHAGLLDAGMDGKRLQATLHPGQCLVGRDGALWRWDGYHVQAGQPTSAAQRLRRRVRLREVLAGHAEVTRALRPAAEAFDAALAERAAAEDRLRRAQAEQAPAHQVLAEAREAETLLTREDAEARARIDVLVPQLARAVAARDEAAVNLDRAEEAQCRLADPAVIENAHDAAARTEAAAVAEVQEARTKRRRCSDTLYQARELENALLARHARHEVARRALAPVLARLTDEVAIARDMSAQKRTLLTELSPDAAAASLADELVRMSAAEEDERNARSMRDAARAELTLRLAERDRGIAGLRDARNRIDRIDQELTRAGIELDQAVLADHDLDERAGRLDDPLQAAREVEDADVALSAAREAERTGAEQMAALIMEESALRERRESLAAGLLKWASRFDVAGDAVVNAESRLEDAIRNQAVREAAPAEAASRRKTIERTLEQAMQTHRQACDALEEADQRLWQAQQARRVADVALATAREADVRAEARQEQADTVLNRLLSETHQPSETIPDDLSDAAESALRRRVAQLAGKRDAFGPVNLRADLELNEAQARIDAISRECENIDGAIGKLRGEVDQLNREGRERLLAVFDQVDRHFQTLFSRMFAGGHARLGIVGLDDPLRAGLEIYAQPPGKKLATLALLSGGEQALTALSLIFAVFRCNPAPICVLDEVDAPLDDANVERFCALLADMVQEVGTRFLIVTHHQLTMTYMDRLYGVTMQERGVSRVLSVDLAAAVEMVG